MRASRTHGLALVVAGIVLVGAAAGASAQTCGDADGDGSLTVIDAANVLRAAVELPSACTAQPARCDLDGSGGITVIDAASVLRRAVDLPGADACPLGNTDVETAVAAVVPLLSLGFDLFPELALSTQATAAKTDPCPGGGTRTEDDDIVGLTVSVELDECVVMNALGKFEFDGFIDADIDVGEVEFTFTTTDVANDYSVDFDGVVNGAPTGDGFVLNGGPITLTTDQGDFTLTFNALRVDSDGDLVSGSGTVEDTDDNFELKSIKVTANGTVNVDLLATFDDDSTQDFTLNLDTGDLTPKS